MPGLTIRDIPPDTLKKIKILSIKERRSTNSEILLIIEDGLKHYINENTGVNEQAISKESQLAIWAMISGSWEDNRKAEEIIDDIYAKRSFGRSIEL
jgi:hypothetical protein